MPYVSRTLSLLYFDLAFGCVLRVRASSQPAFARSLKASDFFKSAFHPEMQREMTVADLVERMGGHGAAHLQQIEELKASASGKPR